MERKDLLKANAKIFETQGKALDENAKKTVKVSSYREGGKEGESWFLLTCFWVPVQCY